MIFFWILLGLVFTLALICEVLILLNLRCKPVPDLSVSEKLRGTRLEPYAEALQKGIASIRAMPWEDVWLTGHGGLRLHGRMLRGRGEKAVLLSHGYRSSGENDFCGIVDYYREHGFSILMIDQRGHGQSEGRQLTFGVRERRDMACWICWAADNLSGELWLHGVSMGAVSLLMALPLCPDTPVRGVIADSVYDNVRELMIYQAGRKYRLPKFPITQIVSLEGCLLMGKDFIKLYASECAAETGIPVFLIFGTHDRTVPPGMASRFIPGKSAQCVFIEGARHARCWQKSPKTYGKALEYFINGE